MQIPKAPEFPLGKLEISLRETLFTYIESCKNYIYCSSIGENLKTLFLFHYWIILKIGNLGTFSGKIKLRTNYNRLFINNNKVLIKTSFQTLISQSKGI